MTQVQAQDSCKSMYEKDAKAKRDKYNQAVERHVIGTPVFVGNNLVMMRNENSTHPSEFYNNHSEKIMAIYNFNAKYHTHIPEGFEEIKKIVNKKSKYELSNEELVKAVREGIDAGTLCPKNKILRSRKFAKTLASIYDLQNINNRSPAVVDIEVIPDEKGEAPKKDNKTQTETQKE